VSSNVEYHLSDFIVRLRSLFPSAGQGLVTAKEMWKQNRKKEKNISFSKRPLLHLDKNEGNLAVFM